MGTLVLALLFLQIFDFTELCEVTNNCSEDYPQRPTQSSKNISLKISWVDTPGERSWYDWDPPWELPPLYPWYPDYCCSDSSTGKPSTKSTTRPTRPTTQQTTTKTTTAPTQQTTQRTTTQKPHTTTPNLFSCCPDTDPCNPIPPPPTPYCIPCPKPDGLINCTEPEPPWHPSMPLVIDPSYDDEPIKFSSSIVVDSKPRCSASIISPHFVVSSCLRCLESYGIPLPASNTKVWVPDFSEGGQAGIGFNVYDAQLVLLHPGCFFREKYDMKYDLGIVQTVDPIEFSNDVGPAKIPHPTGFQVSSKRNLMITALQLRRTMATNLREALWYVKVRAVDGGICSLVLNNSYYHPMKNYCAAYYHRGVGSNCATDFGASLSSGNLLIGILIHKFACGKPGSAASFANVALSGDWLAEIVQRLSNGAENV